jgi:hypothetical protein
MIRLYDAEVLRRELNLPPDRPIPCDGGRAGKPCGKQADVVLISSLPGGHANPVGAIAMCQQCMISTEARLRGARKSSPNPVRNWGGEA